MENSTTNENLIQLEADQFVRDANNLILIDRNGAVVNQFDPKASHHFKKTQSMAVELNQQIPNENVNCEISISSSNIELTCSSLKTFRSSDDKFDTSNTEHLLVAENNTLSCCTNLEKIGYGVYYKEQPGKGTMKFRYDFSENNGPMFSYKDEGHPLGSILKDNFEAFSSNVPVIFKYKGNNQIELLTTEPNGNLLGELTVTAPHLHIRIQNFKVETQLGTSVLGDPGGAPYLELCIGAEDMRDLTSGSGGVLHKNLIYILTTDGNNKFHLRVREVS